MKDLIVEFMTAGGRDEPGKLKTLEKNLTELLNLLQELTQTESGRIGPSEFKKVKEKLEKDCKWLRNATNVKFRDPFGTVAAESIVKKLPSLFEARKAKLRQADLDRFIEAVMPPDPLKDVLLNIEDDNLKLHKWFVKNFECYDSKTINKNAGFSIQNEAQTAWRWKKQTRIFSVDYFHRELFPAFQFHGGTPKPIVGQVLKVFAKRLSPWQTAMWFVSENGWLEGKRPIDLLESNKDEVIKAAGLEAEPAHY